MSEKDCTKCWWDFIKRADGSHYCCFYCYRRETLDACQHFHAKGTNPPGLRSPSKLTAEWQDDILDNMDRGHK